MTSSLTALALAPGALKTGNAALAQRRDRNVVHARARARHRLDARRHLHLVHVGGAQQDGVGMADLGSDLVALARQALQPATEMLLSVRILNDSFSHASLSKSA